MARRLPLQHGEPLGRFLRFLLVGASNSVLTYAIYLACLHFATPVISILLANAAGIVYTALLNIHLVFKAAIRPSVVAALGLYYTAYAFVSAALLDLTIKLLGIRPAFAPLVVLSVVIPVNFVCSRYLVSGAATRGEARP
jgi:putative flippase GtrA